MASVNNEYELSIIVKADEIDAVYNRLVKIDGLAGYGLGDEEIQIIYDTYFDTANFDLRTNGFGLRIRKLNRENLITLKGKGKRTSFGSVGRLEIERPWSDSGWNVIATFLKKNVPALSALPPFDHSQEPLKFIKKAGFHIIHQRYNTRLKRSVVSNNITKQELAELALDKMELISAGIPVKLFEIEIESKDRCQAGLITRMAAELIASFGATLKIWKHSKLSTGIAVQELLKDSKFIETLNSSDYLTFESFTMIENHLKLKVGK
ncbi:MAG: CYTH domain-containing protein [bacterium]|nr:CYTH domain-containing protein [bacterium]